MIGHGPKILLEDLQVDYHARRRKILFVEVLEIAAHHSRLDFVVAVGGAAEGPRGGCENAAGSGGAEKASTRCHSAIVPCGTCFSLFVKSTNKLKHVPHLASAHEAQPHVE